MIYRRVEKESDELLYIGLVTRYGPQTNCQRKRLNISNYYRNCLV